MRQSYPWLELGGGGLGKPDHVHRRVGATASGDTWFWCGSEVENGWVSSTEARGTCQCPRLRGEAMSCLGHGGRAIATMASGGVAASAANSSELGCGGA